MEKKEMIVWNNEGTNDNKQTNISAKHLDQGQQKGKKTANKHICLSAINDFIIIMLYLQCSDCKYFPFALTEYQIIMLFIHIVEKKWIF